MAAPYRVEPLDREGLTVAEYEQLNLLFEDSLARQRAFERLVRDKLRETLPYEVMPDVLLPLLTGYLAAPALPPVLQARLQAQEKMRQELDSLMERQQSLVPQLVEAAARSGQALAARLDERERARQRALQMQQQALERELQLQKQQLEQLQQPLHHKQNKDRQADQEDEDE
jgi:hypothetical protein